MVKINITIEGEDIKDIATELSKIGMELMSSNRKEVREALRVLGEEALNVLMEQKTLERGAQLYRKINREINLSYRKDAP